MATVAILSREAIDRIGFASVGDNVLISDKASIYNPDKIRIGSSVRIDDFCVLSAGAGGISIGSYVHIAVYSALIGAGGISVSDFCNISSRVCIYSSNDDYSGEFMTNPMVPSIYTNVTHEDVRMGKHVIVGSGSVVLPGVVLEDGCAVGALSLVKQNCEPFCVYGGVPARKIGRRRRGLLVCEDEFQKSRIV